MNNRCYSTEDLYFAIKSQTIDKLSKDDEGYVELQYSNFFEELLIAMSGYAQSKGIKVKFISEPYYYLSDIKEQSDFTAYYQEKVINKLSANIGLKYEPRSVKKFVMQLDIDKLLDIYYNNENEILKKFQTFGAEINGKVNSFVKDLENPQQTIDPISPQDKPTNPNPPSYGNTLRL